MQNSRRPSTLPPEALQALQEGKVIEAIKIIRAKTGLGLKESKAMLNDYLNHNPSMKHQLQQQRVRSSHGLITLFIFIIVLVALAYYFLV